ncbi:hypothetical protein WJX72_002640 [[Myrmecia] bisecta]|uniref:Uncharacterized protein n=1 Tax=[Myrmecia] bisecta TaxID=41462 RepID=A0AAW1R633_9CHLO
MQKDGASRLELLGQREMVYKCSAPSCSALFLLCVALLAVVRTTAATKLPQDGVGHLVLPGAEQTKPLAQARVAEASAGMEGQSRETFPELLGMDAADAKAQLEAEFPALRVYLVAQGSMVTMDYRYDRVRIFFDPATNKVSHEPRIG